MSTRVSAEATLNHRFHPLPTCPIALVMSEVIGIDHIYITVSDRARSEVFYDLVLRDAMAFHKNEFVLDGEPHVQYFNRHFGFVLRPARDDHPHNPYSPGLHHFCLRVESVSEVVAVANKLRLLSVEATEARNYPEYAPDYWATYLTDPDGIRLEVTNYRQERRKRHDQWQSEG